MLCVDEGSCDHRYYTLHAVYSMYLDYVCVDGTVHAISKEILHVNFTCDTTIYHMM